jgi:hypothetical protein
MQKDCKICHHKSKPKRPTLTLKLRQPTDYLDFPELEIKQKIKDYLTGVTHDQAEVRGLSRQLAKQRDQRRREAEARRELQEARRLAEERAKTARVANDEWDREQKRKRWFRLLEDAVKLGLQPSQDWNEKKVLRLIESRHTELRDKRLKAESRRHLEIKRQLAIQAAKDVLEDQFDHLPSVARHGVACSDKTEWGIKIGWEGWSRPRDFYQSRGRHRGLLAMKMVEVIDQHKGRRSGFGRGMRPQQIQSRTWEAAAPRKWRRNDQCDQRWNHLFS